MKIIIVGLPLFAERLAKTLTEFDEKNSYIALNTYYNKIDKLKAFFKVPKADVLFSINGTIEKSKVFDIAFDKKVPVVMNWVGTDVLKALELYKSGNYRKDYISKSIHYCEVDWIKDELKQIGIEAEIVNFASFDKKFDSIKTKNDRFTVLSYIPEKRSDFYGMKTFLKLAKHFPQIDFVIAGTEAIDYFPLPENVKALGWVSDMDALFLRSHVCLRFPEHDGLSTFILEAMARGKEVIYKYNFNHCNFCPTEEACILTIQDLYSRFMDGKWKINSEAVNFIEENFSNKVIIGELTNRLKQISDKK